MIFNICVVCQNMSGTAGRVLRTGISRTILAPGWHTPWCGQRRGGGSAAAKSGREAGSAPRRRPANKKVKHRQGQEEATKRRPAKKRPKDAAKERRPRRQPKKAQRPQRRRQEDIERFIDLFSVKKCLHEHVSGTCEISCVKHVR